MCQAEEPDGVGERRTVVGGAVAAWSAALLAADVLDEPAMPADGIRHAGIILIDPGLCA